MRCKFHWLDDQSCFPHDGAMISFEAIPRDPWDRVAWMIDFVSPSDGPPFRTVMGVAPSNRLAIRDSQRAFRHLIDPKKRFRLIK